MLKSKEISCIFLVVFLILLASCKKSKPINSENIPENLIEGPDLIFFAVTTSNKLLVLNSKTPNTIISQIAINGLKLGENIVGIDFRPASGQLYALGSTSRIYIVDTKNGTARAINATPFIPALSGTAFGMDFNPSSDRIRIVSSNGQNALINPENGNIESTDLTISSNAKIGSVAYTQNKAGAGTTILYDVDAINNKLYKHDPSVSGKLIEVGSLGFDIEDTGGFDISPDGATALAALTINGKSSLFTINVSSGKAAKISNLEDQIIGLAIPTEPVAYAVTVTNDLLIFNHVNTTYFKPIIVTKPITGIQPGESILGIDMRPLNGQLYALGSTSRIYTINASSGAATMVGSGPFSTLLDGMYFGIDFNPVFDYLRVISNSGQNLRVNPINASVIVDEAPNIFVPAYISGLAYTNNYVGSTSTKLYGIDTRLNEIHSETIANSGSLARFAQLGPNIEGPSGFDIGGTSGIAYGIFTVGTVQRLYIVDLINGGNEPNGALTPYICGLTIGLGF